MNLKAIESILDSIDPYQIAKDTGFDIEAKSETNAATPTKQAFFIKEVNKKRLRIFNSSFVNMATFTADYAKENYFSGAGIDFLAYYYGGDYDKAFNTFFELYAPALKNKLVHEPKFIKSLIKDSFVKRHEVLNKIVSLALDFTTEKITHTVKSIAWINKLGISNLKQIRGSLFGIKSKDLHLLLSYILTPKYLTYNQIEAVYIEDPKNVLINLKTYLPDCDLYKDSDEWVVIPFFTNFHKVSALHIINPSTNEVHRVNLDNSKVSYSGLFSLNCNTIDFLSSKIRLLESSEEALVLNNRSRQFLTNDTVSYLGVNINPNGFAINTLSVTNALFLHKQNSNLNTIKLLKELYPNFYICDFKNWEESNTVLTWENFLVREFKALVEKNKCLSPEVEMFISVADFNNTGIKTLIKTWLKNHGYKDIYQKLNSLTNDEYVFKNYTITATSNGYIAYIKAGNSSVSITPEETVISNFIIKVDKNILFKNKDDILHKGRVIIGEEEYPVSFYKSELRKKDILEVIALRGFTNFTTADNLLYSSSAGNIMETQHILPSVLEKSFNTALITIVNKEVIKVPCVQGYETIGWDKINNTFAMPIWSANPLIFRKTPQYFLKQSVLDTVYDSIPPKTLDYKQDLSFLNKQLKEMLSIILSYLYRTYLGYPVEPIFIKDSKTARNLIKFIFAAFGQYRAFNLDPNKRVIKSGKIFEQFNKVPLYLRSEDSEILKEVKHVPFFLFCRADLDFKDNQEFAPYDISIDLKNDEYFKVTKFTMDTLERFFKWLFNIKLDEFDFDKSECTSTHQLIREGERIFNLLWWDDIISACARETDPVTELREFLSMLTAKEFNKYFVYHEDDQVYILRRLSVKHPEHQVKAITLFRVLASEDYAEKDNTNSASPLYDRINKELFEKCVSQVLGINGEEFDVTTLRHYTDPRVVNGRIVRLV